MRFSTAGFIGFVLLFVLSAGQEAGGQTSGILFRYLPEKTELSSAVQVDEVEAGPFLDPRERAARGPGSWGMPAPSSAEYEAPGSSIRSDRTEDRSQPLGPQFTVEAWLRSQEDGQSSTLVSNQVSGSDGFTMGLAEHTPFFEFVHAGTVYRLESADRVSAGTNVWVAATVRFWQGTLSVALYVDGAQQASSAQAASIPSPYTIAFPVMLGASAAGPADDPTLTGDFTGQLFGAVLKMYEAPEAYLQSSIPHDGGMYFGLPAYHDYPLEESRLPMDLRIQDAPVEIQKRFYLPHANDLYIPQGTATRIEGLPGNETPLVFVAYYHRTRQGTIETQHSIVAEIDATSGQLRRTFRLMGQLARSHAGGVAWSHGALYISSSGVLERYPVPDWEGPGSSKYVDLEADAAGTISTPSKASFVSAFNDTLWVGDYRTSSDVAPYLFAHALDENGRPNPDPAYRFPLPRRIQGVDLFDGPNGTVVALVRNRNSSVAELLRYRRKDLRSDFLVDPDSVITMPHGIEDLSFMPDGSLWTNSESGTDYYQRRSSGAWSSFYPFVYGIPARAIFGKDVGTGRSSVPEPTELKLNAYPNPFQGNLRLSVAAPQGKAVSIYVVDILGRRVQTIAEGIRPSGQTTFNLNDLSLPPGVFFAVVDDGVRRVVKPVLHVR